MFAIPDDSLKPARMASLSHLSTKPEVLLFLEQLHFLTLSVCPDCLVQLRNDDGLIYVPVERCDAGRNKNLLTMWAEGSEVRMRIMPNPEEKYDPAKRLEYLARLIALHETMLAL